MFAYKISNKNNYKNNLLISNIKYNSIENIYLKESKYADRILFELPESAVITAFDKSYQLTEIIRSAGAKIGVDQCGRQLGSMEYLQKLQPNYIKLDQSFANNDNSNQNNELCRALINIAKGLHIETIITGIEDEEVLVDPSWIHL